MDKKEKILIIKTGYSEFLDYDLVSRKVSLGDVIRTTPLLHAYKNDEVTWVTDWKAFPLLENNSLISRLMPFDFITSEQLKSEEFDRIINLEKISGICALSDKIHDRKGRYGFVFNTQSGKAEPYDKALEVLAVSSDPKTKKENKKTTQELLFKMVGKKWKGEEYILGYVPKNKEEYDIGLNVFVGDKWITKSWSFENWDKIENLLTQKGFKVSRQDKQDKIITKNLKDYINWLNSCKTIISNDSLGLHLGIALKKNVLGLFGPTPHKEVYFYGRGKAILPEPIPNCMPCFKGVCERGDSCMNYIIPKNVYKNIEQLLKSKNEK